MLATRMRMASGVWDGYLYKEGDEYISQTGGWVQGYTNSANYSQSKESDHLFLKVSSSVLWDHTDLFGTEGVRTWVTDNPIDLTEFNQLKIYWRNDGSSSDQQRSYFVVSTDKTAHYADNTKVFYISNRFTAWQENMIDVSDLSGNYYIRVHARGILNLDSKHRISEISVGRIWVE